MNDLFKKIGGWFGGGNNSGTMGPPSPQDDPNYIPPGTTGGASGNSFDWSSLLKTGSDIFGILNTQFSKPGTPTNPTAPTPTAKNPVDSKTVGYIVLAVIIIVLIVVFKKMR